MLKDIIAVEYRQEYKLYLTFEDGISGEIDISKFIEFSGIFAPLKELSFFKQVEVNREIGTIVWPNGTDLDPDVLYAMISGETIPDYTNNRISVN